MARYWKAFETQEARKKWEAEQKAKNPDFKVCMRFPARELEKDLCMPKGRLTDQGFRFCTVYGFKGDI